MGLFARLVVGFVNWLSSIVGTGDFTALIKAQDRLNEFHEGFREQSEEKESSTALVTMAKWLALGVATAIAGFVVYRLFRSRRFMGQEDDVEETRESLFSWQRANDDVSGMFAVWWKNMFPVKEKGLGAARIQPRPGSSTTGSWVWQSIGPTLPGLANAQRASEKHLGSTADRPCLPDRPALPALTLWAIRTRR